MTSQENAAAGCLLVGDYVDEADCPPALTPCQGEPIRPLVVADYVDLWAKEGAGVKEFTVLVKETGVVKVRGHKLKWLQGRHRGDSGGVFAIVQHAPDGDTIVAMFHNTDVLAIFSGAFQPVNAEPNTAPATAGV